MQRGKKTGQILLVSLGAAGALTLATAAINRGSMDSDLRGWPYSYMLAAEGILGGYHVIQWYYSALVKDLCILFVPSFCIVGILSRRSWRRYPSHNIR